MNAVVQNNRQLGAMAYKMSDLLVAMASLMVERETGEYLAQRKKEIFAMLDGIKMNVEQLDFDSEDEIPR